jgi:hypothetical protein
MIRSASFERIASWLALGLFCAVLILSLFVPVYVDEISIGIVPVRELLDGFRIYSLFPQCGPDSWSVPWALYPSAIIDHLIYGYMSQPIYIRLMGGALFVAWLGMLWWFATIRPGRGNSLLSTATGIIAFVSLGVLPFLMVLNRGEQTLLLGVTFFCLMPHIAGRLQLGSRWTTVLLVFIYFVAASYLLASHPKSLFFLPVMVVSALQTAAASGKRWLGIALLASLAWVGYDSFNLWTSRMSCPGAPLLDAVFKSQSLQIGELFTDPVQFILSGLHNLAHSYVYIKNALFELQYQSDWLPPSHSNRLSWLSALSDLLVSPIYVLTVLYLIYALALRLLHALRAGKLEWDCSMAIAVFVGVAACSFFTISKNFYESSLILPLVLLMAVLMQSPIGSPDNGSRMKSVRLIVLLTASILSQANLLLTFIPYVGTTWLEGGRLAEQSLSISPFNFDKVRKDIESAAARCGIKTGNVNTHLVIDNSTYFPFKHADRPLNLSFITKFSGKDIGEENLVSILKQRKSAGVITSCDKLPPSLLSLATETGNYCCILPESINR